MRPRSVLQGALLPFAAVLALVLLAAQASAVPAQPTPAGSAPASDASTSDELAPEDLSEYDPFFDEELDLELAQEVPDPFEVVNRKIFGLNRIIDRFAWTPVTKTYQFIVPAPVRRGVHRMFLNLDAPVILGNQLLQLNLEDGAKTVGRFVLNSTVGLGGFFDPAADGAGWPYRHEDFGQTMAFWGVPSGPYIIIPVFGPTTARDGAGAIVDLGMDPLTWLIGPIQWAVIIGTGEGISLREAHAEELKALEEASLDFYSALRSVYFQSRQAAIENRERELAGESELEVSAKE
jgi:phospholipid-binding lipoprotein MlaA